MPASRSLEELRELIDAADDELLELLNRRARLVVEVGQAKARDGLPSYYVPERERAIIDRLKAQNPGPFPESAIRPVVQEVISACLSMQAGVSVAYLGPEATFTHQAVKRHFGTSAKAVPCGSITAVFDEVGRGAVDFGVVPVENSTEGVVTHTLDSFAGSPLTINAEILVSIEQCLLVRRGLKEAEIERVYSHPQALAQCRGWLQANLPKVALVDTASTADAARSAHSDPHGAAIAAELAAPVYNLEVLRQPIQDQSDNTTRFLVIGDKEPEPSSELGDDKTTLVLALPDSSGALYEVLQPLSGAGINLTKIESRPSKKKAWDYVFFLDLDGHRADPGIGKALEALEEHCDFFQILGSYRKADPL
jgi:chorismate mutase/prephenate dehydratase